MKFYVCCKCSNLYTHPNNEGVDLTCGAFVDFDLMDIQDALDHGVRPSLNKGLKLGDVRFASVVSCGGQLDEISEEEFQTQMDKLVEGMYKFKGVRERK